MFKSFVTRLSAAGFLLFGLSVHAAPTVYVDAGGCAGQSPCFATIQEGVNNAGGSPATVNIFPGTYNESVDISLMGSVGGGANNLTIQAVDAGGAPTVGGVDVFPAAGEAFWNSVDPFPFSLTFNGVNVSSGSTDAIDIEGTLGPVTITDMTASGAANDGIDIRAGGAITLTRVNADNNGNDGMELKTEGAGDLMIVDSNARNNNSGAGTNSDDDGIEIHMHDGEVHLRNLTITGNGGDGVDFRTWAPLSDFPLIPDSQDPQRMMIDVANAGFPDIPLISIYNVNSSNNGDADSSNGEGFDIRNDFDLSWFDGVSNRSNSVYGTVSGIDIRFSQANDNGSDGFQVNANTEGNLTVMDTVAHRNGNEGYEIDMAEAPFGSTIAPYTIPFIQQLTMIRSQAIGNDNDGFQLESEDENEQIRNITLIDTLAQNNGNVEGADGYELAAVNAIVLSRVSAINNGSPNNGDGIEIGSQDDAFYTPQTITASDITAIGNGDDNIEFEAFGNIELRNVIARDNQSAGPGDGNDNIELVTWAGGNILLEDCEATGAWDDGVQAESEAGGTITIRRCNVTDSGSDGIDTADSDGVNGVLNKNTTTSILIEDVYVQGNQDDGIQLASAGSLTINRACVQQTADTGFFLMASATGMSINNSVADANTAEGFRFRDVLGPSVSVTGTNITGNTPGALNEFAGTVSMANNWWNAGSGPTDPANPGGTGDAIVDGDNGGMGTIGFTPFLAQAAAGTVNCAPVTTNDPADPQAPLPIPPEFLEAIPSMDAKGLWVLLASLLLLGGVVLRQRV